MILAAALLFGAALVGSWAPRPLHRVAFTRLDPAAAITWWLLAAAGIMVSAMAGLALLVLPGHGPTAMVMRVLHDCWWAVGHDAPAERDPATGLAAAGVAGAAAIRLAVCWTRRQRRRDRLHQGHLDVLRIAGSDTPGSIPTLWLRHDQPIAYSLGGRRALIVASDGLAERLSAHELRAVFAHEHAHLRGRHHLLISWADVLGKSLRVLPLMRELPAAIRVLVELAADRTAVLQCGAEPVRSALVAIAAQATPPTMLAMSGGDTAIRLRRIAANGPTTRFGMRLAGVAGAIVAAFAPMIVAAGLLGSTGLIACL